jgi:Zn-dependent peptidase ImmA (M78 family)
MEKMISVNPTRLKYAREFYGLSVQEVAISQKINESLLQNCESGEDFLTYSQLERLADFYNQSLLFFFMKEAPKDNIAKVAFRKIEQDSGLKLSKKVMEMMEKANIYKHNLEDIFEGQSPISFTSSLAEENISSDDDLSIWLRKKLDLSLTKQKNEFKYPVELVEYLRDRFFKLGIYIFKDSFRDDAVSGLCLYDNLFPVIILNNKTSFTRQLFTIFHESYHIYQQKADVFTEDYEEKACDKFAGEFLIPEEDLRKRIAEISDYENIELIANVANIYKVSREAILFRLLKKHLISIDFYEKMRDNFIRASNSETSGGNFYYTRISYLGKPYINTVFKQFYSGKISISQVSVYTQLKAVNVPKLASSVFGGGF